MMFLIEVCFLQERKLLNPEFQVVKLKFSLWRLSWRNHELVDHRRISVSHRWSCVYFKCRNYKPDYFSSNERYRITLNTWCVFILGTDEYNLWSRVHLSFRDQLLSAQWCSGAHIAQLFLFLLLWFVYFSFARIQFFSMALSVFFRCIT